MFDYKIICTGNGIVINPQKTVQGIKSITADNSSIVNILSGLNPVFRGKGVSFTLKRVSVISIFFLVLVSPPSFGAGIHEPSDVHELKRTLLSADGTSMRLAWAPNPKAEKIDKYAIFGYSNDLLTDSTPGILIAVTGKTSITIKLNFKDAKPFYISQGRKHYSVFWVIAHNKWGWGENERNTPNPGSKTHINTSSSNNGPNFLYLEFPCTAQGEKNHVCLK